RDWIQSASRRFEPSRVALHRLQVSREVHQPARKRRNPMSTRRTFRKPVGAGIVVSLSLCALTAAADKKLYPGNNCTTIDNPISSGLHYSFGSVLNSSSFFGGTTVNIDCPAVRDWFNVGSTPSVSSAFVIAEGTTDGSGNHPSVTCRFIAAKQASS